MGRFGRTTGSLFDGATTFESILMIICIVILLFYRKNKLINITAFAILFLLIIYTSLRLLKVNIL